jgi:acyl carrier protein
METITKLIARVLRLPESKVVDSLHMRDAETWDSLKHMELIVAIEQACQIELTGDDIADMVSVGAIRQVLTKRGIAWS